MRLIPGSENESLRCACVVPAWNEAPRIEAIVRAVPEDVVETIVVVDDGSDDDTAARAEAAGATVIRQGRNRGVGAAIRSGIDFALARDMDLVAVISGSGKTPPHQLPRLLEPVRMGQADLVQGSRYCEGGETAGMPPIRRWGTRAFSLLFSLSAGRRVADASSGFRVIRLSLVRDAQIDIWQGWLDRYELEPYLLLKALRLGYRVVEVPVRIEYPSRSAGMPYTKMRPVVDWWRIARPLLLVGLGLRR